MRPIWNDTKDLDLKSGKYVKIWQGPQHPGVTGNMALEILLEGDEIMKCDTHVGYLHRGFERLMERRKYIKCFPIVCRICVPEPDTNEYLFATAAEDLGGIEIPERAKWLRALNLEMARLGATIMGIGGQAASFGLGTIAQWSIAHRDLILDLFEELTGGRIYHMYMLPGGVRHEPPAGFEDRLEKILVKTEKLIYDIDKVMFNNYVFKSRAVGLGVLPKEWIKPFGVTGSTARASGVKYDVRKDHPYLIYDQLDFEVNTSNVGDVYDRTVLRKKEVLLSVDLIRQILRKMPKTGSVRTRIPDILHWKVPAGETYVKAESGRGEYGYYMVSDGTEYPKRVHVRGASYTHAMALLEKMAEGVTNADIFGLIVLMQAFPPGESKDKIEEIMSLKDIISPFYAWKRAFEKPYTIVDPVNRKAADSYRGFHTNDIEKCIGCGSCEEICQNEAIDMVEVAEIVASKGDSGLKPLIDYGRCCWCALCVDICPTKSLNMSNEYTWLSEDPEVYRFIPGIDELPWKNESEKGYKRGEESWLVNGVREQMPELEPDERKTHFEEFQDGYTDEQAIIEANRCLDCGICVESCPTHMDIPQYIKAIRDGELDEGLRIMFQTNPMVEACGRICTANCETVCAVGHEGKPIAIRWLKRYIGDKTFDRKDEIIDLKPKPASGKKVGIIGGGPAGLTAAYYLRTLGHDAVIYEMHDKLGGMLKWGIPDYRLPADVLQREIDYIIRQDVDVKYNTKVGKDIMLDDIHKDNDAVFVCIGAQLGTDMEIEGLHQEGVLSGVGFLEKIGKGERPDLGKDVVVVGGGNTAMDCCRSSVRLGSDVKVVYRRTEKEMPADEIEIIEAKEEGVDIQILSSPVKIEKKDGRLAIECIKMELGEPDKSGRRRPEPIDGSEYTIIADTCIMAVGQKVEPDIMKDLDIKLTRWGTFEVNTDTMKSNQESIYAGGDCETGPDDAIRAIAAGKKAAYFIDKQFKNN